MRAKRRRKRKTSQLSSLNLVAADAPAEKETRGLRHNWFNPDSERLKLSLSLLDINGDEYKELHSIKSSDPDREFIDIVMEYCSKRAGKERWVEKTPDNIRYRSLIKKQWPDAKFIHVIREYKDIYASWKTNRKESIQDFIDKVKYIYEGNLDYLGKQTDDYLEVNYNDLVLNTEATMRNVFRYIGEQWHDSCKELDIDITSEERKKFKNIMNRESATLVSLSKPIFSSSVEQWKEIISRDEQLYIETELNEFYEIYNDHWSVQEGI